MTDTQRRNGGLRARFRSSRAYGEAEHLFAQFAAHTILRTLRALILDALIAWAFLLIMLGGLTRVWSTPQCVRACFGREPPCCWNHVFVAVAACCCLAVLVLASCLSTRMTRQRRFQRSAMLTVVMLLSIGWFLLKSQLPLPCTAALLAAVFAAMYAGYRAALRRRQGRGGGTLSLIPCVASYMLSFRVGDPTGVGCMEKHMTEKKFSYPKDKIKILLLENVHPAAVERLQESGYGVEALPDSLGDDELRERIADAHVLGIRSKTKVKAAHLEAARRLLAIGCFGVGTNQVDLDAATTHAVPVFNAPYGSTRSVAELAVAHALCLARKLGDANRTMHQGLWEKSAKGSHEVRGRVMGIVGYGHIGQQVGLLAEALGLRVIFYDQTKRLPLGNAKATASLEELLREADFVSLHVPGQPGSGALIGAKELSLMKKDAALINLGRGSLVDLAAVRDALQQGKLGGAGIDVFNGEPKGNKEEFRCELTGVDRVVLTPHVGGSTEEAQFNIGLEVASAFVKFIDSGCTVGAVNFPQVDLPPAADSHRILNVHQNVPGVLSDVNKIISDVGANINSQYLGTYKNIGYLIMDVSRDSVVVYQSRCFAL